MSAPVNWSVSIAVEWTLLSCDCGEYIILSDGLPDNLSHKMKLFYFVTQIMWQTSTRENLYIGTCLRFLIVMYHGDQKTAETELVSMST